MIVTRNKPREQVLASLESVDAHDVFLVGCGQCAAMASTGGEPELAAAVPLLEEQGFHVTGRVVPEVSCNLNGVKRELRRHAVELAAADTVLVFTCGAGVQAVAEAAEQVVLPALDSAFLGTTMRFGEFEERCRMCGDCVLGMTAGICPVTQCAKGLLNGPCGGMWDGRCEVFPERECAHVCIQKRLAEQGRTYSGALPPKDFSVGTHPQHVVSGRHERTGGER